MKILVVGIGRIGRLVAEDLLNEGYDVYVTDIDKEKVEAFKATHDVKDIDYNEMLDMALREHIELVCTAVPSTNTPKLVDALIKKQLNVVDVTGFGDISPYKYVKEAEKRRVILSLYNGLAPGLSHIIAGKLYREMGGGDAINIYVGGLPKEKYYGIFYTFNPVDYLRQYVEKARHVRNGEVTVLDPLEHSGLIELPDVGILEYFPTNGLYSLLWNMEDVKDKAEYTLRYRGHLDIMRSLRYLGLLEYSTSSIGIDGVSMTPLEWTARLTEKTVKRDRRDIVVLYVVAKKGDEEKRYLLIDRYDEKGQVSAMSRCTGYSQSIVAQLFLEEILDYTIHYPEEIGLNEEAFNLLDKKLRKKGIIIRRL